MTIFFWLSFPSFSAFYLPLSFPSLISNPLSLSPPPNPASPLSCSHRFGWLRQGQEPESFFVSAGFALTHPTSVTDITAIEAVRVEELDEGAVSGPFLAFRVSTHSLRGQ